VYQALAARKQSGLEIIPAVEMSTLYNGGKVHILGCYVDISDKQFLQSLANIAHARLERARKMVKNCKTWVPAVS